MSDSGLELPREASCSFCKYIRGDRPYTILERGSRVATLVTREQRGLGHVLVIPIAHIPSILDLNPMGGGALMEGIVRAATAIEATFSPTGIAVWQNNGISAGQAIAHLHFHVAGTVDSEGTERGPVPELSVEATDAMADRLRQALPASGGPEDS